MKSTATKFPVKNRSGVSLIEVVVSMLIMSIGIISLASLLPISILRTAQATQMTHAVFLRRNVEAILRADQRALGNNSIPTPAPNTTQVNTLDGITYAIIDPLGVQLSLPANFGGIASRPRFSGSTSTTSVASAEVLASWPDSWTKVYDGPLKVGSASVVTRDGTSTASANLTASPPWVTWNGTPAISGLFVRNSNSANAKFARHRMVLTDVTGKNSVLKPLLRVEDATGANSNGQNLTWWDVDVDNAVTPLTSGTNLPTGFIPTQVRIEVNTRHFTSMMTVRKQVQSSANQTWAAVVDVAVFFNRAFSAADETPFQITFDPTDSFDQKNGTRNVDDDYDGLVDNATELGWRGSDDNRTVTVTWTTTPPSLKKGGFMLDPLNLVWYRILDLRFPTTKSAVLLLDQDIQNSTAIASPVNGVITLKGVFMKGVVEVYPIGTFSGIQ